MASKDQYIKQRPGRANLYYQRAVPAPLQATFGKVITESLGTSDRREARLLRDQKNVEWGLKFKAAENRKLGTSATLEDRAKKVLTDLKAALAEYLNDNNAPSVEERNLASHLLTEKAESVLEDPKAETTLPLDLQQSILAVVRSVNDYLHDPVEFDKAAASQLLGSATPKKPMSDLRDMFLKAKKDEGVSLKNQKTLKSRLAVLEEHGWDAGEVKTWLEEKGRTEKTVENWMTSLTTFSKYLGKRGITLEVPAFKRRKYAKTRDVFTIKELKKIAAHSMDETMRWVTLVCLHQGFRASEALQLEEHDVRQLHGVWVFDVHDRGEKSAKNASTVRKVPIHPWLIDNGFLEYWEKHKGWARNWKSYDGTASQGFSKEVNPVIREALGLKDSETPTGKKVFHSLRHTFRDHCREAGLQEYTINLLGGWSNAGQGEGAGYGHGHSTAKLRDQLKRVKFLA